MQFHHVTSNKCLKPPTKICKIIVCYYVHMYLLYDDKLHAPCKDFEFAEIPNNSTDLSIHYKVQYYAKLYANHHIIYVTHNGRMNLCISRSRSRNCYCIHFGGPFISHAMQANH